MPINYIETNFSNPTCADKHNGSITINNIGFAPSPPILYYVLEIRNPSSFLVATHTLPASNFPYTFSGLGPDNYTLTATAYNGANSLLDSKTETITLTAPAALSFSFSNIVNPSTPTSNDGSIEGTISPTDQGPYKVQIYNNINALPNQEYTIGGGGATNFTFDKLTPGAYTINLINNVGCEYSHTIYLPALAPIQPVVFSTDAKCHGENGKIHISSVTGGATPYKINIAGSSINFTTTAPSFPFSHPVPAGSYNVTITDQGGAFITIPIEVYQPEAFSVNLTQFKKSSTPITPDGAITGSIQSTSPNSPYTVTLFNNVNNLINNQYVVGGSEFSFDGLLPGVYTVNVENSLGCSISKTIEIEAVQPIQPIIATTAAKCNGELGAISIQDITGGSSPYKIELKTSGGSLIKTFTGPSFPFVYAIAAGDYLISITDQANKTVTLPVVVPQPLAVSIALTKTDATSAVATDGEIKVVTNGGSGDGFKVILQKPDGSKVVEQTGDNWAFGGLLPGRYTVLAEDITNGCTDSNNIIVGPYEAQLLPIIKVTNVDYFDSSNGTISVDASGGLPPYRVEIYAGVSDNPPVIRSGYTASPYIAEFLPAGFYTIKICDSNELADPPCKLFTVKIDAPQALTIDTQVFSTSGCDTNDGAIYIKTQGGIGPLKAKIFEPGHDLSNSLVVTSGNNIAFGSLKGGVQYTVYIEDSRGASAVTVITVPNKCKADCDDNHKDNNPPKPRDRDRYRRDRF